jgi:hypothetical protein
MPRKNYLALLKHSADFFGSDAWPKRQMVEGNLFQLAFTLPTQWQLRARAEILDHISDSR